MKRIIITAGSISLDAELNDSPTARAIWKALPITGKANTWGDEIYFTIPVCARLEENARADVDVGDLAYWPTGAAFCVFFGKTPVSTDDRPCAASPVTVVGKVAGDAAALRAVTEGTRIEVATAEGPSD